jgi:hypothetical protein
MPISQNTLSRTVLVSFAGKIRDYPMTASSEERFVLLQANIICLLLFLVAVATIFEHLAWFR